MHIVLWWKSLATEDHLHDIGVEGRIIVKRMLKEYDRKPWTGMI